jgi:hypothetical protein
MYEFHRVGWINADHEETSGWLCLIDTKEKLDAIFNWKAHQLAHDWVFDVSSSPKGKYGHCRTTRAGAYKDILMIHMETQGKKRMSMPECISFLEKTATSTVIQIFYEEGKVYVNAAGGCRRTHLRNDGRGVDEHIFEKCTNKDLIFPCLSAKEIRVHKWPGGRHWYIQVNGKTIDVDGRHKYNTVDAAEDAMERFVKENRFKKEYLPN